MKSKWKVLISDEKMYAVYRLIDTQKPDHSGNREFAGEYIKDREVAEWVAAELNLTNFINR